MPRVLAWLTYANYMRFGITASMIDVFGLGRCPKLSPEDAVSHWTDTITEDQMLQIYGSDKINADLLISSLDSINRSIQG